MTRPSPTQPQSKDSYANQSGALSPTKRLRKNPISRADWEWHGTAGHFIAARSCRFHMTTLVGKFIVSTVGEYFPSGAEEAKTLGIDRLYETMVFHWQGQRCNSPDNGCGNCGCPIVDTYSSIDFDGYNTAGAATRGHYALCDKWAAQQDWQPEPEDDEEPIGGLVDKLQERALREPSSMED